MFSLGVANEKYIPKTKVLPLSKVLLIPERGPAIDFVVRNTSAVMKITSEIMNAILVECSHEHLFKIGNLFVRSVTMSIGVLYKDRKHPPSMPEVKTDLDKLNSGAIELFYLRIKASTPNWTWPVPTLAPVEYAINQYLTCLTL